MLRTLTPAAAFLISFAGAASAHDTWLLPDRFSVAVGGSVELAMTSGMNFPANDVAVAAERLAENGVRGAGAAGTLKVEGAREGALRLSAALTRDGVAAFWATSRPRTVDRPADQVGHYLDEIGHAETAGKAWEARGRPAWRETYVKMAKTFVAAGKGGGEVDWRRPVGLPLELVPDFDPTAVTAGRTVTLRLLWEGKPVRIQVTALDAGGQPSRRYPDAEGRVSFTIASAGPWLFKATRLAESAGGAEWASQFTTLTIEAKASR